MKSWTLWISSFGDMSVDVVGLLYGECVHNAKFIVVKWLAWFSWSVSGLAMLGTLRVGIQGRYCECCISSRSREKSREDER